jgi:ElaB/YqjD/DUF883 family membrane-anchored ribosome-binding protein
MARSTNHNANRISAAAENLSQTVGEAVRDLPENFKSLNREFTSRASSELDRASKMASQYLHEGRESAQRLERVVEDRVRSQPWQALLVAFGVGALVAYMTRPARD